jgi:hypothetical protein
VSISIGPSVAARIVESLLAAQRDVSRPVEGGVLDVPAAELEQLTTTLEAVVGTIYTDLVYPQLITYPQLDTEPSDRHDDAPGRTDNPLPPTRRLVGLELSRACQRVGVRLDELTTLIGEVDGDEARRWFRRSTIDARRHLTDLAAIAGAWAGE